MKRRVWRSGNSWVITIPSELAEKLNLMERKLVDFDIKDVFEETGKIFDNLFGGENMFGLEHEKDISKNRKEILRKGTQFRHPLLDLKESETDFIISIEIPGVDKKDIQLNVTDNQVEVKVEKNSEFNVTNEEEGYIRSERVYNGFYRSINLPSKVISENARASYKNGILELRLSKAKKEKNNFNRIQIE